MKEKISGGKLALSLTIYILGYILITLLATLILSLILSFLIEIPIIKNLIGYFFSENPDAIRFLPVILSIVIPYVISETINNKTERTHYLSTFIFGIILVVFQSLAFILNLRYGLFEFINLFEVFIGIGLIVSGKKFLV